MIFISYRKADTQPVVDNLAKELKKKFGAHNVFKDDTDVKAGDHWPNRLLQEVLRCEVLLAVIGEKWLTVLDEDGNRRIDDEDDWVRREICTALANRKRIIVLLVGSAKLPNKRGLPKDLQPLLELHVDLTLRPGSHSEDDIAALIKALATFVTPLPEQNESQLPPVVSGPKPQRPVVDPLPELDLVKQKLDEILNKKTEFGGEELTPVKEALADAYAATENGVEATRQYMEILARRVKVARVKGREKTSKVSYDSPEWDFWHDLQKLPVPAYDLWLPFKDGLRGGAAKPTANAKQQAVPAGS